VPCFTVLVYLAVKKGSSSVDYLSMRAQGGISWKLIQYGTCLLPVQQVGWYESLGPVQRGAQFSGLWDSEVRI